MEIRSRKYEVVFEIAGNAAIFTRPDSGSVFLSYPAPTFSAVCGMLDCVVRYTSAYLRPLEVKICAPVRFQEYKTNYGGPLRNPDGIRKNNLYQLGATILVDVCYQITAVPVAIGPAPNRNNHLHALQEIFYRRLDQGRFLRTPCLGWSEFTPTYFGRPRVDSVVCEDVNLTIPTMLYRVFDKEVAGTYAPTFLRDVQIVNGVLAYD